MKVSLKAEGVAGTAFTLLFPGFYLYHQLLSMGVIGEFLGGWFSPIALIFLILFLPFLGRYPSRASAAQVFFTALMLLGGLCFFVMAIKYAFTGNNELLFQAMLSCLLYVVLFSIGLWLDFESRRLKSFVLVSAALIFVYLVYFVASTGSLFYYAAQINETGSRVASYQGFARSVLILGFVLIAFQKRYMSELLCIAMVAFMLFVLGARSEFVGFAFSCLVYMTMRAAREGRKAVVLFLSGLLVFMFVQLYTGEFAFSRHSQLLNISESSSMVARNELSLLAWERILENSFWGGWEAHFENGGKGTYAHNILSVWDTYGFLALLLYFGLLSYPVGYSLKMLIARDKLSSLERALVFLAPCVLLLSLVAKSVYWPIPALMWGIYISCKRQALLAHRGLYC